MAFGNAAGSRGIAVQPGIKQAENSDVSFDAGLIATAVMTGFPLTGTYESVNVALPEASVD